MVLSNLRDARESLRDAEEEAGMGTSLMIEEVIEQLTKLIERTENINDE